VKRLDILASVWPRKLFSIKPIEGNAAKQQANAFQLVSRMGFKQTTHNDKLFRQFPSFYFLTANNLKKTCVVK
jgi:hypothetical protein